MPPHSLRSHVYPHVATQRGKRNRSAFKMSGNVKFNFLTTLPPSLQRAPFRAHRSPQAPLLTPPPPPLRRRPAPQPRAPVGRRRLPPLPCWLLRGGPAPRRSRRPPTCRSRAGCGEGVVWGGGGPGWAGRRAASVRGRPCWLAISLPFCKVLWCLFTCGVLCWKCIFVMLQ